MSRAAPLAASRAWHAADAAVRAALGPLWVRWAVLLTATAVGFHEVLARTVEQTAAGDPVGYVLGVPLYAALAAAGVAVRHRTELPIHDRQTDGITSTVVLVLALALLGLLGPRFSNQPRLWEVGLGALVVLVVGGAVLLLGLRPVTRYRGAWLVLATGWPLPYRVLSAALGASRLVDCLLAVAVAALATAVAVGHSRTRRLVAAAATLAVGGAVAVFLAGTTVPLWVAQLGAGTSGAVLVLAGWLRLARPRRGPDRASVVPGSPASAGWVLAAGLAAAVIGAPATTLPTVTDLPAVVLGTDGAPGWVAVGSTEVAGPTGYYGPGAHWQRTELVQTVGSAEFDVDARPRRVVVDAVTVADAPLLQVVPLGATYAIPNVRTQRASDVDLGHGVTGRAYAVVDDDALLTYSILTFTATLPAGAGATAERVTLVSVDDHRDGARFLVPDRALGGTLATGLARVVRGDAAFADRAGRPKDVELLTGLGRSLVAGVQPGAAP
ncbi:hypothetical protein GCM10027047_34410 [Rhodococcus aerolatus]